jgi:hypothetical protein
MELAIRSVERSPSDHFSIHGPFALISPSELGTALAMRRHNARVSMTQTERYWFSGFIFYSAIALSLRSLAHLPDTYTLVGQGIGIAGMLWILIKAVTRERKT